MAKAKDFNLAASVRAFKAEHKGLTGSAALEAFKAEHKGQKINESSFKQSWYTSGGNGKPKTVKRRKPMVRATRGPGAGDGAGIVAQAISFIRSAGSIAKAKEVLAELETVKNL